MWISIYARKVFVFMILDRLADKIVGTKQASWESSPAMSQWSCTRHD